MNRDDEDIGERLLSILEEKYPELHTELIASNPFNSPLIGLTPGKGHRRGAKFPSISEIISRIESGESVNQDWENILLGHLPLSEIAEDSDQIEENDELEEDDESLVKHYRNLSVTFLRRMADNDEIIGAWSMNRDKLISAYATRTEKMGSEIKKLGRVYPTIPRVTDWTIFVMENVNFFNLDYVVNFNPEDAKE